VSRLLKSELPSTGYQLKGRIVLKGVSWTIDSLTKYYDIPSIPIFTFLDTLWKPAVIAGTLTAATYQSVTSNSDIWQNFTTSAYRHVVVPVADFQNDEAVVLHPVRCTGSSSWRGSQPRRDNVFIKKDAIHGQLDGRMPARVEAIFAINDLVLQKIHEVAFITEYKAVAGGLLHDPS
jgi:hypothetical protein